jgi:hypothetical protein
MSHLRCFNSKLYVAVLLLFICALLIIGLSSCATTGKGQRGSNNQVNGKNTSSSTSYGDNYVGSSNEYGSGSQEIWGLGNSTSKTKNFFSFRMPFDLSTFNIGNLTHGETELYGGFFGLAFLGGYVGFLVKKIFWRRK